MEQQRTIINIGRQFGCGGLEIAGIIGRELGIRVYDSELISQAAERSGISPDLFKASDEKRRLWGIGNIFGSNRYGALTSGLNDGELFKLQSEVIRDIASRQSAIFVGRASDYILRDMDCLDVFICAPMEIRRERISEKLSISIQEAEKLIEKTDKGRAEYYNFFTFGHWGKASGYDLCIDSSVLGLEGTASMIIEFGRRCAKIQRP